MNQEPLRVLVVEDDVYTQDFMEVLLTDLGHQVTLARNGLEALRLTIDEAKPFDIVLMDMQMPEMDGLEATRRLKSHPTTRHIPVLCVSAKASGSTEEAGLCAGCDSYLTKPCWEETILKAIERLLTERNSRQ